MGQESESYDESAIDDEDSKSDDVIDPATDPEEYEIPSSSDSDTMYEGMSIEQANKLRKEIKQKHYEDMEEIFGKEKADKWAARDAVERADKKKRKKEKLSRKIEDCLGEIDECLNDEPPLKKAKN